MDRRIVLCSIVAFLGLLSTSLAFAAEATRIKIYQVTFMDPSSCTYPRSSAMGLGLVAALALVLAQVIVSVASGCICCRKGHRPLTNNKLLVWVSFVISWVTFVLAFLLLLTGAALNDQHDSGTMYMGNYYCYVVKPGVFAGGAVLTFCTVSLGLFYYLAVCPITSKGMGVEGGESAPAATIALGQPQFNPPQPTQRSSDPVFVHEDTYMRRQFT